MYISPFKKFCLLRIWAFLNNFQKNFENQPNIRPVIKLQSYWKSHALWKWPCDRRHGTSWFDDVLGETSVRSLRHIWSKMPKRCVGWNYSSVANKTKNIAIYVIPFYGDDRPIVKSRRKHCVYFVRKKREEKWSPSKHSIICLCNVQSERFI